MIKKFKVEHRDTLWECSIKIDVDRADTLEAMKQMVDFWTGSEDRLENNNGDLVKTFVQQLGREIFYIMAEPNNYNIEGVKGEFSNREGWCAMDGSYGIWISETMSLEFDYSEFEVEEVAS